MAGPLLNSDGSAEWHEGTSPHEIKMITAVNGPLEVKLRDELPQQASVELVYRPNSGVPMIRERLIQDKLHTALVAAVRRDLLPRSLIQVVVQLVDAWHDEKTWIVDSLQDPSFFAELSTGINSMSLAVLNCGIPCRGVVAAASYAYTSTGDLTPVFELNKNEKIKSLHAIAYLFEGSEEPKVVVCESLGEFNQEELLKALDRARNDTHASVETMRERL